MKKNKLPIFFIGLCLLSANAWADISGTVFEDSNANGVFDSGVGETGVFGVSISAFDSDDPLATPTATTVSGADGSYTLSGLSGGTSYRIEFSGLSSGNYSSLYGADSLTSVGFIADPATAV